MNQAEVNQKAVELNKLGAEAMTLEKRYSAHLMLYEAACMTGNEGEISSRREECHTLLDGILDNTRSIHFTSKVMRRLLEG
jgi:hypothetical protein